MNNIKVSVATTSQEFTFNWTFMTNLKLELTLTSGVKWKVLLNATGVYVSPMLPCPAQKYIIDTWYQWTMFIVSPRGPIITLESGFLLAENDAKLNSNIGDSSTCIISIPSYMEGIRLEEDTKVTMACWSHLLITELKGCGEFIEATTNYPHMFLRTSPRNSCVIRRIN